jgi:wyosine [tRNA(Phe)-imidazoG37] synthetase (radical SAM superfamily)
MERITEFAQRMSKITGHEIVGKNPPSKVVLLSNGKRPLMLK